MFLLRKFSMVKLLPDAAVQEKKATLGMIFEFQLLFHKKDISLERVKTR